MCSLAFIFIVDHRTWLYQGSLTQDSSSYKVCYTTVAIISNVYSGCFQLFVKD